MKTIHYFLITVAMTTIFLMFVAVVCRGMKEDAIRIEKAKFRTLEDSDSLELI